MIILLSLMIEGKTAYSERYFTEKKYNTDSLKEVLITSEGLERIHVLCLLADQFIAEYPDTSLIYALEAYNISRGTDDRGIDLLATYTLGHAYHRTGDYPMAIRYSLDALELAKEQHDTTTYIGVMHIIGISYLYSNNGDMAVSLRPGFLEYFKNWKRPEQQFEIFIRVGWIYMMAGHYREAVPYFLKAGRSADATSLVPPVRKALNYAHIIRCYLRSGDYDSTKYYVDLCERFCRENDLEFNEFALHHKAELYFMTYEYDSALANYRKLREYGKQSGSFSTEANGLIMAGKIFRLQENPAFAIEAFTTAIDKAEKVREFKSFYTDRKKTYDSFFTPEQSVPDFMERLGLRQLTDIHLNLYELYKSLGKDREALMYLEKYNEVSDRLRELDRKKDVMEINTRYETEQKEQRIHLLTTENEINALRLEQTRYLIFALAGFILLGISVTFMLIRQSRMRTLQDKAVLEQKLLRAQMNPHFLFNTLTNIQGYMIENDVKKAGQYLSRFARLMRNILYNTSQEWIPLSQEISTIENYMELQKSRFQGKFDYLINIDESIDPEETHIPPMLTQPFIENAIEHGIRHLEGQGKIEIHFKSVVLPSHRPKILQSYRPTVLKSYRPTVLQSYSLINLEIIDNGVGREKSAQIEQDHLRNHRPMATSITKERLIVLGKSLNRKIRKKIRLEIVDLFNEEGKAAGTIVRLTVPAEKR